MRVGFQIFFAARAFFFRSASAARLAAASSGGRLARRVAFLLRSFSRLFSLFRMFVRSIPDRSVARSSSTFHLVQARPANFQ